MDCSLRSVQSNSPLGLGRADRQHQEGTDVREEGNLNVLTGKAGMTAAVSETLVRVNYSETDQMGVVYHARYLVWLDVARCDHLRHSGMSYRELEEAGLRLVGGGVSLKYRPPAPHDDLIRIFCWGRAGRSRKDEFWYFVGDDDGPG